MINKNIGKVIEYREEEMEEAKEETKRKIDRKTKPKKKTNNHKRIYYCQHQ